MFWFDISFGLNSQWNSLKKILSGSSNILQAMTVARICDDEGNRKFEIALARNMWKLRAEMLLGSGEKPTLQQIQHHLKEVQPLYPLFISWRNHLCLSFFIWLNDSNWFTRLLAEVYLCRYITKELIVQNNHYGVKPWDIHVF